MFYIDKPTWTKIMQYSKTAHDKWKSEISGMLLAEKDEEGDWSLHSPVILKQTVSSGNTTLDKEELSKYYARTGKKYKDSKVKFVWWHSHHTMGAFWSGTDDKAIKEYKDGDWSLALVVNLKEEYKFRVSYWDPVESHEDIELQFNFEEADIPKSLINEVEKKCSTNRIVIHKHNGYNKETNAFNYGFNTNHTNPLSNNVEEKQYGLWDDYDGSWINAMNFIDSTISKYDSGLIEYKEYMDLVANFNKKELKDSNYYVQILSLREMQDLKIRLDDPKDYVDPIDFIQPRKSMYSDRLLV